MTTTTQRVAAAVTVALALATSVSTASAAFTDVNAGGTTVRVPSYAGPVGSSDAQAPAASPTASAGGFDWGDAGIGAAGGVGLSIVGVGGLLAASSRRARRPQPRVARTS